MGTINPVRIRLRYPDLDSFVEKFAPNVTRGGVFLASRNVQPVGSIIDFEIQLVTGEVALGGRGKVTWVKEFNPAEPNRPFGMGVQFVELTATGRAVLTRILRTKAAGQPPPRGLSGMHATLGAGAGSGPAVVGGVIGGVVGGGGGAGSGPNGKAAAFVDTSVDLAAELGVSDAALRVALDRRRTALSGRVDDDLADLMRRDPVEAPTLAQALADLPRLLDPQSSRRRAAAGFLRPVESSAAVVDVVVLEASARSSAPAGHATAEAAPAGDPRETTVTEEPAAESGAELGIAETESGEEAESAELGTAEAESGAEARIAETNAVPGPVVREPSSGNRSGRSGRRHQRR